MASTMTISTGPAIKRALLAPLSFNKAKKLFMLLAPCAHSQCVGPARAAQPARWGVSALFLSRRPSCAIERPRPRLPRRPYRVHQECPGPVQRDDAEHAPRAAHSAWARDVLLQ